MQFAINLLLGALTFFGLGYLLTMLLLNDNRQRNSMEKFPVIFLTGMLTNYTLVLILQRLPLAMITSAILALTGLGLWAYQHYALRHSTPDSSFNFDRHSISRYMLLLLLFFLYLVPIISQPLIEWDARSIWFFHGKMIFTHGGMDSGAGWRDPAIAWANIDYPKFNAVLVGQFAYLMGYWNEYLPKASIIYLLLPALVWTISFFRFSLPFLALILLLPFGLDFWLWNGYMDGYLAYYFAIALLLYYRYLTEQNSFYLYSALLVISLLPSLKNDGLLAMIALTTTLLLSTVHQLKNEPLNKVKLFISQNWSGLMVVLPGMLSFIIWHFFYKLAWGLNSQFKVGTSSVFEQAALRLSDPGELALILFSALEQFWLLLLIFVTLSVIYYFKTKKLYTPLLLVLSGAGLFFAGMYLIYLITPFELKWQLDVSINRTMLTVKFAIGAGIFILLSELEKLAGKLATPPGEATEASASEQQRS